MNKTIEKSVIVSTNMLSNKSCF